MVESPVKNSSSHASLREHALDEGLEFHKPVVQLSRDGSLKLKLICLETTQSQIKVNTTSKGCYLLIFLRFRLLSILTPFRTSGRLGASKSANHGRVMLKPISLPDRIHTSMWFLRLA